MKRTACMHQGNVHAHKLSTLQLPPVIHKTSRYDTGSAHEECNILADEHQPYPSRIEKEEAQRRLWYMRRVMHRPKFLSGYSI